MKIRKIVKKDLKLFKRDTKTLMLVIFAPILILTILAFIFNQPTTTKSLTGVDIGLCNLDNKPLKEIQFSIYKFKQIPGDNCKEKTKSLVIRGQLKAAIVIPKDFSKNIEEGYGSEIILYLDNSRYQSALVINDAIKAMIQDMNENIGTEFIKNAWINLRDLNNRLKQIVVYLEIAKGNTEQLQLKVDEINKNLDKINEKEIDRFLNTLNSTQLINQPINLTKNLDIELTNLGTFYSKKCFNNTIEECEILNQTLQNLYKLNKNIAEYERKINLLSANTTNLNKQISSLKKTKANIKEDILKLNTTLYNYTDNTILLINELNQTSQLLDIYTNKDPKNIVRPVSLNINKVFGNRTHFAFLAPGLILILLLFTILLIVSSNIVEERKKGTLARTLLSPTSIPTLLTAKIAYFMILCAIEIIAMLIVLSIFGISFNITINTILILIIASINFIVLGLLIGSVSNSENTALLTSLVIALPMFFLSNLFFPLEIMPNSMKSTGTYSPLTLSIQNLDKLTTYSTGINYNHILILLIYPLIICIITYLMIKRKPTSV